MLESSSVKFAIMDANSGLFLNKQSLHLYKLSKLSTTYLYESSDAAFEELDHIAANRDQIDIQGMHNPQFKVMQVDITKKARNRSIKVEKTRYGIRERLSGFYLEYVSAYVLIFKDLADIDCFYDKEADAAEALCDAKGCTLMSSPNPSIVDTDGKKVNDFQYDIVPIEITIEEQA